MEQTLTTSLLDNKLALKGLFGTATDFYTKDITLMGYPACICMFEGLSSIERLWIMMLDVLSKPDVQPETPEELFDYILKQTAIPLESKSVVCVDCLLYTSRRFFADILGTQPDEVIVGGNSSLNMMYYLIDLGWRLGFADSPAAWNACGRPKFLCPAPGYDRHFRVTEYFGFELITVPMLPTGPDMDCVEAVSYTHLVYKRQVLFIMPTRRT